MKALIIYLIISISFTSYAVNTKTIQVIFNITESKEQDNVYKLLEIKSTSSKEEQLEAVFKAYSTLEKKTLYLKKKDNANYEFMSMQIKKIFDIERNKNSSIKNYAWVSIIYDEDNSEIVSITEKSNLL